MHSPTEGIHVSCVGANCMMQRLLDFAIDEVRLRNTLGSYLIVLGQLPPGNGGLGQVAVHKRTGWPFTFCLFLCTDVYSVQE